MFTITTHSFPFVNRDIIVRIAVPKGHVGILPYIITHDGQNSFDVWEDKITQIGTLNILGDLIQKGSIPPVALVGIDTWDTWTDYTNLERCTDYSPWISDEYIKLQPSLSFEEDKVGGRGDQYADFTIQTLVPFLEENYQFSKDPAQRMMLGLSMGAMITLYITTKYQGMFSKIGLMSPALWCFQRDYSQYLSTIAPFPKDTKIYMDIGRKESSDPLIEDFPKRYMDGAFFIFDILSKQCPNVQFTIDQDGEHDIRFLECIAKRMPGMFTYLWNDY